MIARALGHNLKSLKKLSHRRRNDSWNLVVMNKTLSILLLFLLSVAPLASAAEKLLVGKKSSSFLAIASANELLDSARLAALRAVAKSSCARDGL
jgi:hypothetical protein